MSQLFDFTSAGQAEQAVDFVSQWLQTFTEYAVVGLGLEGTILFWNEGARRLYGYEPGEMVGRANAASLQDPADPLPPLLETALQQGKWVGARVQRRQDGQFFKARVTLTPARDSADRLSGFLWLAQDLAAKSDLAQELLETRLAEYQQAETAHLATRDDEKLAYRQAMIYAKELKAEIVERRRVEAALQASETRYRHLIERSPDAIILQCEDETVFVNRAATQLLRYWGPQPLLGQPFIERVHPHYRRLFHWQVKMVAGRGLKTPYMRLKFIRRDDSPVLVEATITPAVFENKPAIQVIARDITWRVRTEAALRESENRYRQLIEQSPDPIVIGDLTGTITLVNHSLLKLFGYERAEEMIGQSGFEFVVPEGMDQAADYLQRVLETGSLRNIEYTVRQKDGTPVPIEFSLALIRDLADEPTAMIGVLRDISERRQAEAVMRYQAALVDNVSDAIVATDSLLNITVWNNAAEKIYGWSVAEVLGKSILEVIPAEFPGTTAEAVGQQLVEQGYWHGEMIQRRKDGTQVYALASTSRLKNDAGELIGAVTINYDLTERKKVEAELSRHVARNEALLKISAALAEVGLDVQAALETIARQAALTIGDACVITRLSEDEQRFESIAFYHADPAVVAKMTPLFTPAPIPVTVEWLQPMITTGQPLFVPVVSSEEARRVVGRRYGSYLEQVGVHSLLIVPLQIRGRVIGTLGVSRDRTDQPYTADDLIFLQELADRAALTIQNAHLFEDVEQAHEQLQALSLRLLEVQESERRYLARELHDEVGQLLTGLKLKLELSARRPAAASQPALAEIQTLVNDLVGRVRSLSLDLRPSMLDDLGLLPALLWHFERYTAQTGIEVIFRHNGLKDQRFPPPVETAVYRLVQEALTNVARHAGVSQAQVQVWTDPDLLHLQVKDEGRGFAAEAVLAASSSVGLRGMQERVALLGGWLMVESTPGSGACLIVELPLVNEVL